MLEKPDLPDDRIIRVLQDEYGISTARLAFLPLGADVNTAVYRLITADETACFLKLRKGDFAEIALTVPIFLMEHGVQSIVAPIQTRAGRYWANVDAFKMVLYPFVEGKDGYQVELSEQQWFDFGAALRGIHTAPLPPAIKQQIPRETYSPLWRELVKEFLAQVETTLYADPVAAKLAVFMREKRAEIAHLVGHAGQLAQVLQSRPLDLVLCHSDIHAGNLLITGAGQLYIVDWDNPKIAPKEHDLMHFGGSTVWNSASAALFYRGYGPVEIDQVALAYYRCERIIQDIAEFCKQLLLTGEGGQDREQSLRWFTGQFLPGHEVEIARRTDRLTI